MVVAFVLVTFTTSIPFHRKVEFPSKKVLSLVGIKSELILALIVKLSDVSFPRIELPLVAKFPVVVV